MDIRKHLKGASTLSITLGVTALLLLVARFQSASDIPLPFGFGSFGSSLTGNISQIGIKGGIAVKKVTFPTGTDAETLGIDQLYLVVVPDDPAVTTQALDDVFTIGQSHSVNYFGYKYTSVNATTEKANKNATLLTDRFPGQFFASAKARAEDPQHGNAISAFETANSLTMAATNALTGATLEKNSLYFIIVNEASGATLTIRTSAQTTCGDGTISGSEACDDSNTVAGDGCDATCAVESGFVCSSEPSSCHAVVCGDGTKEGSEACDDSNTTAGDGCSAICTVETGFACTGTAPSVCSGVCGDGLIKGAEVCDDSNTTAGDGCSTTCAVESGFSCTGIPSECSPLPSNAVAVISQQMAQNATLVGGTQGITLSRFKVIAGVHDVLMHTFTFAIDGNVDNTNSMALWRDTNADGVVDQQMFTPTILNGVATFHDLSPNTSRIVNAGQSVYFELRANVASQANVPPYISVNFKTDAADVIAVSDAEAQVELSGVSIDGVCGGSCEMSLTTVTPTHWEFAPVCGNGIKQGSETCDDGNTTSNDGCSNVCALETGFTCTNATPNVCSAVCGDGLIKGTETCDDSNTTAGDGCSAACAVESNFRCTGAPSTCQSYLDYVKALADTNNDGTVSQNEALILTLDVADAPNQPYNTVSQYDMEPDNDVDNTDVSIILAQLDILAP